MKHVVRATLLASFALTSIASADDVATYPPAPAPEPPLESEAAPAPAPVAAPIAVVAAPVVAAPPAKKTTLSAGLFYGSPHGEFKDDAGMTLINDSPGLSLSAGYAVVPELSLVGMIHLYSPSSAVDGIDLSMWDIGVGARYAHPVSPVLSIYGEAYLQHASYTVDYGDGYDWTSSGTGIAAGGGVMYAVNPNVSLGGGLTYSTVTLESEESDSESAGWLGLNAFAAYHL